MNWGKLEDQQRMVFKIPIRSPKKWWQFWKKEDKSGEVSLKQLMSLYKDYWFPSPFIRVDRSEKISRIKNKIDTNYHSLYE